ncbi:UNVERIFIED_CONTAM: hypothetical protein Sradi_6502200 [Sesamum radiatum]|uniref:Lipoprotein n=1 Tax=Sesamum radiatum TaxID=300843 RepID=A0AAW2JVA0_SESRA
MGWRAWAVGWAGVLLGCWRDCVAVWAGAAGSAAWLEVVEFGAAPGLGLGSDRGWACWAGRT